MLAQARKIFPKVDVAEDFMKVEIPLIETEKTR
jgi:ribonuclease BN (tRNA processing enzyme)